MAWWKWQCSGPLPILPMAVLSFANNIHTIDGGTHLDGFKQGVTRTINDYARSKGILKEKDSKPFW